MSRLTYLSVLSLVAGLIVSAVSGSASALQPTTAIELHFEGRND